MQHVIGIDTSTTATKAVVIDRHGAVVAEGADRYDYDVPRSGWSEQDPGLWWTATTRAVRAALIAGDIDPHTVVGVGLTGQMHGLVLLDAEHRILRPAILWNDQRTAEQCDAIRDRVGADRLIEVTGNEAMTGFTAVLDALDAVAGHLRGGLRTHRRPPDRRRRTRARLLPRRARPLAPDGRDAVRHRQPALVP